MKYYLIEHVDGGKWMAPQGFVAAKTHAMQFPTQQDAESYLKANPKLNEWHHPIVAMDVDDAGGRYAGQVATDYDPWGHHRD